MPKFKFKFKFSDYYSIEEIFENAIKREGIVVIENNKGQSKKDVFEEVYDYFNYMDGLSYFSSPISFSRGEVYNLTPKKSKYLDRIIKHKEGNYICVDLYEILNIKEENRNIESLKVFQSFYKKIGDYIFENNPRFKLQFLYETNPMRMEIRPSEDDKDFDFKKELKEEIESNELLSNFFNSIAKDIKILGRWSWITISKQGMFPIEKENKFYEKYYN